MKYDIVINKNKLMLNASIWVKLINMFRKIC